MFLEAKLALIEFLQTSICWIGAEACSRNGKCEIGVCHLVLFGALGVFFSVVGFTLYLFKVFVSCAYEWIEHPPTDEELDEIEKEELSLLKNPFSTLRMVWSLLFQSNLKHRRLTRKAARFDQSKPSTKPEIVEEIEIKKAEEIVKPKPIKIKAAGDKLE